MKTKSFILLAFFLLSFLGGIFTPVFACSEGDYGPGCDDDITTSTSSYPPTTTTYDGYVEPRIETTSTSSLTSDSVLVLYCGNTQALNYQTEIDCQFENRARPQNLCFRNDSICVGVPVVEPKLSITFLYCGDT